MVLVLPSLGLTSAKALFEWGATVNEGIYKFRWQCIFVPNNGAFFVNFVITSAFIGTAAELVRLPELLLYAIKLACARSAAERTSVRKSVVWEFQFGCQYAWMLCVFAVMIAFSLPCPLIAPFGLVYLLMKHLVDRYNIYFAYAPSKIDTNIHASAINYVIVSVILLQCSVLFFTVLRADSLYSELTVFSLVALFLTLIVFFGRMCFGWFRGISPIRYRPIGSDTDSETAPVAPATGDQRPFIPSVLLEEQYEEPEQIEAPNLTPASVQQSYGSVEQGYGDPNLIQPGTESFNP